MEEEKYILVCSQKGGTGKSTFADELLYSFDRTGVPADFINLDEQVGVAHKPSKRDDAEVAVVDTPGHLLPNLADLMSAADLIVIPCRASVKEMVPLRTVRDMAAENAPDVPVVIVVNGWNRFSTNAEFLEWLKGTKRPNEIYTSMLQSEQVLQAASQGESIVTYNRTSKAAAAMLRAINVIRQAAGFLPEQAPRGRGANIIRAFREYTDMVGGSDMTESEEETDGDEE